jgi:hypothetical protein
VSAQIVSVPATAAGGGVGAGVTSGPVDATGGSLGDAASVGGAAVGVAATAVGVAATAVGVAAGADGFGVAAGPAQATKMRTTAAKALPNLRVGDMVLGVPPLLDRRFIRWRDADT